MEPPLRLGARPVRDSREGPLSPAACTRSWLSTLVTPSTRPSDSAIGGSTEVQSPINSGTTVRVRLPLD